MIIKH